MDFDELDRLQEVLEPALLEIIECSLAPAGLAQYCREKGLVTCEGLFEAIDTSHLASEELTEHWWDTEDIFQDLVRLASELEPPALKQVEIVRLRDVWRACRKLTLDERERREAECRLRAQEAEARREREAELMRERAREARQRADAQRAEAERCALEAKEAERRAKEAAWQKQLQIKLQAMKLAADPTFRALVVPASRAGRRRGPAAPLEEPALGDPAEEGPPPPAAARELCARLRELAEVLGERYRRTTDATAAHVLDSQIGQLPEGNLTVGFSATWGLEVTEERSGRRAVRLAREEVLVGGLVEVCPLLRVPVEAGGVDQGLRSGPLGRSALWPPALGPTVALPLGFGSMYRQSLQGWNVTPSLAGDGSELRWIACERLSPGEEIVAPQGWQELAMGRAVGEDRVAGGSMEGPALGSTRHGLSPVHGFGVFSTCAAEAGEVLEISPALHLPGAEARLLENYAMQFDLGRPEPTVVLALGLGAVFNHRKWPQVDWLYDCETDTVAFVARQRIEPGEELFIDYGQVYFSSRGVTPACRLADVVWRD